MISEEPEVIYEDSKENSQGSPDPPFCCNHRELHAVWRPHAQSWDGSSKGDVGDSRLAVVSTLIYIYFFLFHKKKETHFLFGSKMSFSLKKMSVFFFPSVTIHLYLLKIRGFGRIPLLAEIQNTESLL